MAWAAAIAASAALLAWALVVLDLGRRLIRHADALEERRRLALEVFDAATIHRRIERLEQAERQTADVLSRGRR